MDIVYKVFVHTTKPNMNGSEGERDRARIISKWWWHQVHSHIWMYNIYSLYGCWSVAVATTITTTTTTADADVVVVLVNTKLSVNHDIFICLWTTSQDERKTTASILDTKSGAFRCHLYFSSNHRIKDLLRVSMYVCLVEERYHIDCTRYKYKHKHADSEYVCVSMSQIFLIIIIISTTFSITQFCLFIQRRKVVTQFQHYIIITNKQLVSYYLRISVIFIPSYLSFLFFFIVVVGGGVVASCVLSTSCFFF